MQLSLDATLVVAGIGMALVSIGSLLSPAVRNLGLEPVHRQPSDLAAAPGGPVAGSVQPSV